MNVVFLIGSGASKPANMPMVPDISDQVFRGDETWRHTDGYYCLGPDRSPLGDGRENAKAVIDFVGRLRQVADDYSADFMSDAASDYEEVANLATQVEDAISGEYENPGLAPLLHDLRDDFASDPADLAQLAGEGRNYIADTVCNMLGKEVGELDYLRVLTDACHELGTVALADLNHDRVLDAALVKQDVDFSDGFGPLDGDVHFWADTFDEPARLLKLHGSIAWFRYPGGVARAVTNDPDHAKNAAGAYLGIPAARPALLVGTFAKALGYGGGIFADQHFRFHEGLRTATRVVTVGYGFRDKAINSRLIDDLEVLARRGERVDRATDSRPPLVADTVPHG